MKKIISILTALTVFSMLLFSVNIYAVSLDTANIDVNKTTIRPGEEATVTVNFGENLGAYTANIAYDNNIFDYVSAEGGTANDTGDKVVVVYHDATGETNPRNSTSVVFKAKEDITTSNPTEFTVTATGLANADASVTYDDITTPMVKQVTVEPEYVDYTLKLEYTGEIVKEQEKDMTLSYSSSMGRYYEHASLIAEATTPTGANVQLLAIDASSVEYDIIDSGWGDPQGFEIGGKDVAQELAVKGIFSHAGDYAITLKLIDRDNSDNVIAQNTVNLTVQETATTTPESTLEEDEEEVKSEEDAKKEETPTKLPKTGNNVYAPAIAVLVILTGVSLYTSKKINK